MGDVDFENEFDRHRWHLTANTEQVCVDEDDEDFEKNMCNK